MAAGIPTPQRPRQRDEWAELDARFARMHRINLRVQTFIALALLVALVVLVSR